MLTAYSRDRLASADSIRLSGSPYTYVRTIVMESELLQKEDYDKLLKMQLTEMIQFLEESTYREEIDELAIIEEGVQLVEHAVQRNFRRAVEKLRRISEDELKVLIDVYLWRNDIQNYKTLIRAKYQKLAPERVANLFIPGTTTKIELLALYSKPTAEDIIDALEFPYPFDAKKLFKEHGLSRLETEMTKSYYRMTINVAQRIYGQQAVLREFLTTEVEVINLLTVLKLKRENATEERIRQELIEIKENSDDLLSLARHQHVIQKLLEANNIDACFVALGKTKYREAAANAEHGWREEHSLLALERELNSYLLRRAVLLTHRNPLSIDVVLAYLFAKVYETRNIFVLIKGKQLNVDNNIIEKELVIR